MTLRDGDERHTQRTRGPKGPPRLIGESYVRAGGLSEKSRMTGAAMAVPNRQAPLDHTVHGLVTPSSAAAPPGQKWAPSGARTVMRPPKQPCAAPSNGRHGRVSLYFPWSS